MIASNDADEYGNDAGLELAWAKKAYDYAETHINLLRALGAGSLSLRLSKFDQEILDKYEQQFPQFDLNPVEVEQLKSEAAKARWREFAGQLSYVDDYNFGTLLRLDPSKEYTEENSIFVTKIQFLAIEIARNRRGLNGNIK